MLWQLSHEDQTQPALSPTLGDPGYLLEEYSSLLDAFSAQKFMGLFDDDESSSRRRRGGVPLSASQTSHILLVLHGLRAVAALKHPSRPDR